MGRDLDYEAFLSELMALLGNRVSIGIGRPAGKPGLLGLIYGDLRSAPEVQDDLLYVALDGGSAVYINPADYVRAQWVDGVQRSLSVDLGSVVVTVTPVPPST